MPSYTQYKRQMAVLDADDSEIESWITVRGNHIPIMKGQSKGDAVKAFIEKKGGEKSHKSESIKSAKKYTSEEEKKSVGKSGVTKSFHDAAKERLNIIKELRNKPEGRERWRLEQRKKTLETQMEKEFKRSDKFQNEIDKEKWLKEIKGNKAWEQLLAKTDKKAYAQLQSSESPRAAKPSTKKEYDPAFEIDRKNALANYYLYGGKYTQRSKQAAYKEWKHDTSSEENLRAANKWVNSELVPKQSKPSDSSKGGSKKTKKYPQDLVDMAHSVMAYGGFGMKPEDILNDSYHGQYLKRYTEKYGKELVLETLKEMASRIDRVDYNVYTGSEGETYNSVIWKAPQLETLPDEEWEATLKKLYKDRGSEKKQSKPSDASAAGGSSKPAGFESHYNNGFPDIEFGNDLKKEISVVKSDDWHRRDAGISFGKSTYGDTGTSSTLKISDKLYNWMKGNNDRINSVQKHYKMPSKYDYAWEDISSNLGSALGKARKVKGGYEIDVDTTTYSWFHD